MALFNVSNEAWRPARWEPGPHPSEVIAAKESVSSKGREQVELKMRALEGPHAGKSRVVWIPTKPESEAQEKFVASALRAFGFSKDSPPSAAKDFLGRKVVIVVEHQKGDDDEVYDNVAYYKKYGTAGASGEPAKSW